LTFLFTAQRPLLAGGERLLVAFAKTQVCGPSFEYSDTLDLLSSLVKIW